MEQKPQKKKTTNSNNDIVNDIVNGIVNDIGPVVDIVNEYPYSFHIDSARKRGSPLA